MKKVTKKISLFLLTGLLLTSTCINANASSYSSETNAEPIIETYSFGDTESDTTRY